MAFKFVVLCATLAYANAGLLGASIASPAIAYGAAPTLAYGAAPALAYGAAPALAYGAAAPTLGSTFHGRLAAPAIAYGAAPALAYGAAAPTLGSTFHGRLAAPAIAAPVAYGAPAYASAVAPAITSQHSNIIRSFGNLGQVSTYSKSIDTPFSSVRKADIRVSNPGLRTVAAPALSYAAPALSYAAPAISSYAAAPVLRTAVAAPAVGLAYSAAPAVSHLTYAGTYANYGW